MQHTFLPWRICLFVRNITHERKDVTGWWWSTGRFAVMLLYLTFAVLKTCHSFLVFMWNCLHNLLTDLVSLVPQVYSVSCQKLNILYSLTITIQFWGNSENIMHNAILTATYLHYLAPAFFHVMISLTYFRTWSQNYCNRMPVAPNNVLAYR